MYTPLSPGLIRLLSIQPGGKDDPIECTLKPVDLNAAPQYEALSYTWGDAYPPATIRCNNVEVKVTQNLAEALNRIRDPEESKVFWIDAICINQGDLDERSEQVSIMKRIYESAKRVCVWLGRDDDGDFRLVNIVLNMVDMRFAVFFRGRQPTVMQSFELLRRVKFDRNDWPIEEAEETAFWRLFQRPWFERIWVVQEVAVSSSVTMMMGDHEINLDRLGLAIQWLQYVIMNYSPGTSRASTMWLTRHKLEERSTSLEHLLRVTKTFKSTDPRDKLYGILGVSKEGQNLDLYPELRPDYTKEPGEIYTDMTRVLIKKSKDLSVLNSVQHIDDVQTDGFPSWVARWDSHYEESCFAVQDSAKRFKASRDLPVSIKDSDNKYSLIVKGFRVCLVFDIDYSIPKALRGMAVFVTPSLQDDLRLVWSAVKELWLNKVSKLSVFDHYESMLTAYVSTLTCSCSSDVFRGEPFTEADFAAYCLHHLQLDNKDSSVAEQVHAIENFFGTEGFTSDLPDEEKILKIESFYGITYQSRRNIDTLSRQIHVDKPFIITNSGHIGLASRTVFAGDVICILFGGKTPYLIRRTGDSYRFVGECYIHGIMEGVIIDSLDIGNPIGFVEEWFDLR
ncbi:heterokaryon incompatibility protein-domain-containing protein [Xylogone sp. PMI_703]|nr:heterokaryon incompatibility protein-domain-containing protein [Xylogone sp. PMI_703]